ncbi:MAG: hypothetical protein SGCHY_005443 [Lobulomycetales sp.]
MASALWHSHSFTGLDHVARLKNAVGASESALSGYRSKAKSAKQTYESLVAAHASTSTQLSTLLSRKSVWNASDASAFTRLFHSEQDLAAKVALARVDVQDAEHAFDASLQHFLEAMRERYAGEQIWGDKLRAASTYWTWGLVGLNLVVFLVVQLGIEPARRRAFARSVVDGLVDAQSAAANSADTRQDIDPHTSTGSLESPLFPTKDASPKEPLPLTRNTSLKAIPSHGLTNDFALGVAVGTGVSIATSGAVIVLMQLLNFN